MSLVKFRAWHLSQSLRSLAGFSAGRADKGHSTEGVGFTTAWIGRATIALFMVDLTLNREQ
jgi:hypothetical protein